MLSESKRNEIRKGIAKKNAVAIERFTKEELVQYIYDTQATVLTLSQSLTQNV